MSTRWEVTARERTIARVELRPPAQVCQPETAHEEVARPLYEFAKGEGCLEDEGPNPFPTCTFDGCTEVDHSGAGFCWNHTKGGAS